MTSLYWRDPLWLLLAVLPLLWLGWLYWRADKLKRRYAAPALWPWAIGDQIARGRHWRRATLVVAWWLFGLAAAGPRLPSDPTAQGAYVQGDLMVVLDLSRSMTAEDVWPDRRRLAIRALVDTLDQLRGARVGLVVVGGRAHLLWPPTTDRAGLAGLVAQLHRLQLPSEGSALDAGVALAAKALAASPGDRHLLLITDGDLTTPEYTALSRTLSAAAGIDLSVAGVGTRGGAALSGDDGDWLHQDDDVVISRLQEAQLRQLAEDHGGRYLTLPGDDPGAALGDSLPLALQHPALSADTPLLWRELFPWLLLPAMALTLIGLLRLPPQAAPAGLIATLLYLAGITATLPARASPLHAAHAALAAGDPQTARTLFDDVPGYPARMGSGTACHRLQDWSCARQAFAQAVLLAANDRQRADAIYNLAHSRFQAGDFAAAAALFDDALHYRPSNAAARHNRDFAQALAAEVARLTGGPQADRRGRGRAASDSDNAAPPDAGRTLVDTPQQTVSRPTRSAADRQALINRGLAFTRLAESRSDTTADPWGRAFSDHSLQEADDISLWQTLIERAEGLPAPPPQPLRLDGVRPW